MLFSSKMEFFIIFIFSNSKNVPDYSAQKEKQDLGYLTFDLQADLNPLFNWNAKQLFVFLTAEYETSENKLNQVNITRI